MERKSVPGKIRYLQRSGGLVSSKSPCMRVFGRYGIRRFCEGVGVLVDAFLLDDFIEGIKKNSQIKPEGEVAPVAQIVAHPLAEGEVVAAMDLGQAGDARPQGHSFSLCGEGKGVHLFGNPGTGTDEAHVSQQDVDEFRQFIQGGAAQQRSQEGGALFVRQQVSVRVPRIFHGFEFDDMEGRKAAANALLEEKG